MANPTDGAPLSVTPSVDPGSAPSRAPVTTRPSRPLAWHQVYEKVSPYLFKIKTQQGHGTGFFFATNDGNSFIAIATASHVIAEADSWRLPIRIRHHLSGVEAYFEYGDRAVIRDDRLDSAAVIIPASEFKLPPLPPQLLEAERSMKVGASVGWMGFPGLAPSELCFFQGSISATLASEKAYLIDGVAVNGVSGGPVFTLGLKLVGILTAYMPNQQPSGMFPGVARAVSVAHLHKLIKTIRNLDAARKAEEEKKAADAAKAASPKASLEPGTPAIETPPAGAGPTA